MLPYMPCLNAQIPNASLDRAKEPKISRTPKKNQATAQTPAKFLPVFQSLRIPHHPFRLPTPTGPTLPLHPYRPSHSLNMRTPLSHPRLVPININPTNPPHARRHNLHHHLNLPLLPRRIHQHKLLGHKAPTPPSPRQRMSLAPPALQHGFRIRRM